MSVILQSFKRANINLVSDSNLSPGDIVVFRDHPDASNQDHLGIVGIWIRDLQGQHKGKSVCAVILPLTPISQKDFREADDFARKNIFGERKGVRHILKPKSQELRSLSVNTNFYYGLGYNVQLPGHKAIPDQDRLRVLSVTPETLLLGEGGMVQKLGACDTVMTQKVEELLTGSFEQRGRASSLKHAIIEKSALTRQIMFGKPNPSAKKEPRP